MVAGNVIEVKNVSKSFKIYMDKGHTIKEHVVSSKRRKYEKREVLKDISFSVKRGEAIGLIGHNGCGKSTTLKLLTKIIYPDNGIIEMKGRVSSLLELGAGFHPDMSGRENIYINASIFGLTRKEIDRRLDDIIAFSELEEFIDNPVRTYSSGMYMRLAFSVAINVDADILLVDEILAVGDVNFQAKCFNRLREIKAQGTTIVIVSHSTGQIEQICDRAIWINEGRIQAEGRALEVVDQYLQFMNGKKIETMINEDKRRIEKEKKVEQQKQEEIKKVENEKISHKKKKQEGLSDEPDWISKLRDYTVSESGEICEEEGDSGAENCKTLYDQVMDYNEKHFGLGTAVITDAYLKNEKGERTYVLEADKTYSIDINYKIKQEMKEIVIGMGFYTLDGVWIFGTNTQLGKVIVDASKWEGKVTYIGETLPLLTGKYILQVSITDVDGTPLDFYRDYCHFDVINYKRDSGLVYLSNTWELK